MWILLQEGKTGLCPQPPGKEGVSARPEVASGALSSFQWGRCFPSRWDSAARPCTAEAGAGKGRGRSPGLSEPRLLGALRVGESETDVQEATGESWRQRVVFQKQVRFPRHRH